MQSNIFTPYYVINYIIHVVFDYVDCPNKPINVQIINVGSRSLTINWTKPHDNNDPITSYLISYQNPECLVTANGVPQNVTVFSTEEQLTITGLHPEEYYTFTVIAINNICPSQPSEPASMRTIEEGKYVMICHIMSCMIAAAYYYMNIRSLQHNYVLNSTIIE